MIDTSNTSTTTKYWRDMDTGCGATDTEHDLVASGGSGLCPNAKRINFAHIGDVAVVIVGAQCVASIQIESAVDSVVLKVRAAFLPALLLPLAKSVSFSAYPSRTLSNGPYLTTPPPTHDGITLHTIGQRTGLSHNPTVTFHANPSHNVTRSPYNFVD